MTAAALNYLCTLVMHNQDMPHDRHIGIEVIAGPIYFIDMTSAMVTKECSTRTNGYLCILWESHNPDHRRATLGFVGAFAE